METAVSVTMMVIFILIRLLMLSPHMQIGSNVRIDGPSILTNATVGDGCHIRAFTVIEDAVMEAAANAGPFARIRIGSHLETQSYAGNFVELKHAHLSRNSLACHLTYLGTHAK